VSLLESRCVSDTLFFFFFLLVITPIFIRVSGIAGNRWKAGPWTLGRFSRPIGIYACKWLFSSLCERAEGFGDARRVDFSHDPYRTSTHIVMPFLIAKKLNLPFYTGSALNPLTMNWSKLSTRAQMHV
jgi:hypothetical protein